MLLCLTIQHGWNTRQIDFTNAFAHAPLAEDVHVSMSAMDYDDSGLPNEEFVLKLNRTLCGLCQSPRSCWLHMSQVFLDLGFKESDSEQGVFFGHGMTVVCFIDDSLFFGPDANKIEELIDQLAKKGFT